MDRLPPELLSLILESVDSPTYSDKERQTDLTSFSLVSRSLRGPAQGLLFARPTIRNAGRAFLLLRTLEHTDSHELASAVRAFSFTTATTQDNAHPGITTSILALTTPSSLTLGSRLFDATHGDAVEDLRATLRARSDVQAFSFGFHQPTNVHGRIYEFLLAWPGLKSLALSAFDLQLAYPALSRPIPPPPTYNLVELTLVDVYIKPLPPLSLSWFLGGTTTSLRSLTLHGVTFNDEEDSAQTDLLFPILPSHLLHITHLSLHNLTWLEPSAYSSPCRIAQILPLCPALRSLSLADKVYDRLVLGAGLDDFPLPATMQELEVVGRTLFWKVGLSAVVERDQGALRRVVLVGPTANMLGVKEVAEVCARKGVGFKTRFAP
ncbi:hypothetical protein RQP46_002974 [Phenoliferia psychrophenolica]